MQNVEFNSYTDCFDKVILPALKTSSKYAIFWESYESYQQIELGTRKLSFGPNNQTLPTSDLLIWDNYINILFMLLDYIPSNNGKASDPMPILHLTIQRLDRGCG